MEKKTLGKFISALRKANGMTQKELGEKLFVSDKTVSRWECDECTPELSLIPVIAEIFGITTDELLRGKRNNPEKAAVYFEDAASVKKEKSDKRFKLVLHNQKKKYSNLSFITIGLAIVGFIVAMICNLGFYRGLLGFSLASIFFIASAICQIGFTVNFRLLIDEEENKYAEEIKKANTNMVFASVKILFGIFLLWAFCLPTAVFTNSGYLGLSMDSWLLFGCIFAVAAFLIAYCVYQLFVLKTLVKKELVFIQEKEIDRLVVNNKLLKRLLSIFFLVLVILIVASFILNEIAGVSSFIKKERFEEPEGFISFVQNDYDKWFEAGYSDYPLSEYPNQIWAEIDGKQYYYNPDLYHKIYIMQLENGEWDIGVTTKEAYYCGVEIYDALNICLLVLHAVNFLVCSAWYCVRLYKKR